MLASPLQLTVLRAKQRPLGLTLVAVRPTLGPARTGFLRPPPPPPLPFDAWSVVGPFDYELRSLWADFWVTMRPTLGSERTVPAGLPDTLSPAPSAAVPPLPRRPLPFRSIRDRIRDPGTVTLMP